ncbi:fasciclin domain-containing protein, partial [Arthrobacter sp. TmT3-37]
MELTKRRNLSILGIAAVSMFGLAACGGTDATETTSGSMASESSTAGPESASASPEASMAPSASADAMMDPAANLVGPGCAGYAETVPDGAGSV